MKHNIKVIFDSLSPITPNQLKVFIHIKETVKRVRNINKNPAREQAISIHVPAFIVRFVFMSFKQTISLISRPIGQGKH